MKEVGVCNECDNRAVCFGRNITAPIAGYWRINATSTNFIACRLDKACLAGDQNNPLGICDDGYRGILCADCEFNFVKTGTKCGKCPSQAQNIIVLIVLVIVLFGVIVLLVKSTLSSVDMKKPLYSVYYKIVMTHFQILLSISSIDFAWPK